MSPETVYQPDFLYSEGRLQPGGSLRVSADGHVLPAGLPGPGARAVRLAGRALFPGLANAHSHAFQRLIRGRTEYVAAGRAGDDFWSWREAMYRAAESLSPEDVFVASRQAFVEMLLAGITTVGEFHYVHHQADGTPYADPNELAHQVIRAAKDVGLRITLLRVGYARAGFQTEANPRQRRFIDARCEDWLLRSEALSRAYASDGRVRVGLAPHSTRAVPREWLAEVSRVSGMPVHMHVAEQPKELEACQAEHGMRPVALLAELGLLAPRFTAVHAVHLTAGEIEELGASGAGVCACPSTERNLGDGVVPADALAAAGVPLSLGSDSQSTIDLLDEARELEGHLRLVRQRRAVLDPGTGRPEGLAARLFEMASVQGLRSLGWEGGALAPGSAADFFTVDLNHHTLIGATEESLLATVVLGGSLAAVREVAVEGQLRVEDGRHVRAAESARLFHSLARRLYA